MARFWGLALGAVVLLGAAGCNDHNDTVVGTDSPPFNVEGVRSVTGDGQVTISWRLNQETDIDHYSVYRNSAPTGTFTLVGTSTTNEFVDHDVTNGTTYYYAVDATDRAGQVSPELSFEDVFDTPRPEGFDVTLSETDADSTHRFYDVTAGPHYLIFVPSDTKIQDTGYVDLVDVDYGPPAGWSADGVVEAIPGHSYIVLTRDNHYAKFEVITRGATSLTMDWAYQVATGNPELVKKLP
jgi:hypothetical protein